MGRAQRGSQTVALTSFSAVLGTRRGSAVAQSQRDTAEQRQRRLEFDSWAAAVETVGGDRVAAELLVDAYCAGAHQPEADGYPALIAELSSRVPTGDIGKLAAIAALGDPFKHPGLTLPLVQALGHYFTAPPPGASALTSARRRSEAVVETCFRSHESSAHFERLRPLCEGLGAFLSRQPPAAGAGLGARAIAVLHGAPQLALLGPLRSWVTALSERANAGNLTVPEREALQQFVTERVSDFRPGVLRSDLEAALAPLKLSLWGP